MDPEPEPDPDPGLTIVLLGHSGVGKSASGNTILGKPAFESRLSFRSVTTDISKITGTVFGKQISVVDTPGILGCEREIQTFCQEVLQSSTPCLFLVVVKIDRFTIEQRDAVDTVLNIIGNDGLRKGYLLFTAGDYLNNMQLDDFINEKPDSPLRPLVQTFEGRCHVFNNKIHSEEQVRELLAKSGHLRNAVCPSTTRRIVLLGLSGGGKSSTGNTILGSELFKTNSYFEPVGIESVCKSAEVAGHWVTVVDTPGFTDEVKPQSQKYQEIVRKSIAQASPGPHAFVIVLKVGRMHGTEPALLQGLTKLLNSVAPNYAMVVFTHGDELGSQSIDQMIRPGTPVSELVSLCGGRFCVFENKGRRSREEVQNFMKIINDMVAANNEKHYESKAARNTATRQSQTVDSGCWEAVCRCFCCCQQSDDTSSDDERLPLLPHNDQDTR